MPNSPVAWFLLALVVTPGWFAIRGWCMARSTRALDALSEWLPLAVALGVTWTGVLALSLGSVGLTLAAGASPAWRVALWIGAAVSVWVIPFLLGWGSGRLWPNADRCVGDVVTVVMNDGSAIHGRCRRISATRLTLEDAASGT